jgi:hypothetical protein
MDQQRTPSLDPALLARPLTAYIVAITSHVGLGTELKTDQEAA